MTPLDYAAHINNAKIVEKLLEKGAKFSEENVKKLLKKDKYYFADIAALFAKYEKIAKKGGSENDHKYKYLKYKNKYMKLYYSKQL